MTQHVCRHCGLTYEYCRGCLLSPISYKENGYCSKACQDADQKQEEVIQTDVEVVIIDEDTSTSE